MQQTAGRLPVSNGRSVDLVDDEAGRDTDGDFACESLKDFDANSGGHLTHFLAKADDLCHTRPDTQRLLGAPVVNFSLPPHRQRLIRVAERSPAALVRRLRMLGDEAAGD